MYLFYAGTAAIGIQSLLLLVWAYHLLLKPNGTDPAGGGIALFILLIAAGYIAVQAVLLSTGKFWPSVAVLALFALPVALLVRMYLRSGNTGNN
ncbi:MAG TPA: hypothetical protein VHK69_06715 [Chitinophagaceae bacterium]|jgi:hypothetical protein|nr:hypothetical protein [Chitinophagaceae bacterium]